MEGVKIVGKHGDEVVGAADAVLDAAEGAKDVERAVDRVDLVADSSRAADTAEEGGRARNAHGGGKNAKHANADARAAAERQWLEAKDRLQAAKRSGATKKEKQKIEQQIKHWKAKMDFTGENHSMKAKR